ncbi:MAG: TraM recognition domain-containing protein [Paenisporosarcina sp.]|nr:TraM recognition domain-containing protein [Paenisporosarcina sp.]
MNEQVWWKQKFPLILSTLLFGINIYMFALIWARISGFVMTQIKEELIVYAPWLFGSGTNVSIFMLAGFSVLGVFSWLFSTRVSFYQSKFMRIVTFFTMLLTVWGSIAAYGMNQTRSRVIPFFEERLTNVITTDGFFESIVFEQTKGFFLMVTVIPMIMLFFISLFLLNKYGQHDKELNEPFFAFEWSGKWLQRLAKWEQKEIWPDIELGESTKNGEMVTLLGRDRTLNTMIIGSIGTGKTAALGLPMINMDLHHMTRYINDYPELYQREDFKTEDVGGRYLSGISIIDPSNDLCQKSLQLVKAHGIPDEAITYINPLDPNTPSINPMRGPVDKVAEVFAQVIAGLNDSKDGGNFFFEQAQRNHLKHYIYLLKLHDTEKEVTLDMLLDMYNNPQLVKRMHDSLKKTFPPKEQRAAFTDRDEINYWNIVQGIDEWFNLNLLPKMIRAGSGQVAERNTDNEIIYYDAKEEHVQGLRNILNDIGANPLIRRVLFGESDFDFDRHMEIGGVLLVNTAKGELVNLARVLGKIVLMNLQNATFRRAPLVSSFHHVLVDEAPDYLYNAFREFPAQSRKYKVILTTLQQTIAQMADQFGEMYMTTLIGTMRNRMVYGDVPGYDAEYFSKMFGEKFVYEEGQNEMAVSPLQESPQSRTGLSYSKVREQAMTGGDIMFQDAFECAVKIVQNNRPMPVTQIKANFVPKEDFKVAKIVANEEVLDIWLGQRRAYGLHVEEESLLSIEETEEINQEIYEAERESAFELDPVMVDLAVKTEVDPHPREALVYQPSQPIPSATPINHKQQVQPKVHIPQTKTDEYIVFPSTEEETVLQPESTESERPASMFETYDEAQSRKQRELNQTDTSATPLTKGEYEESQTDEKHENFVASLNIEPYSK